MYRSGALILAAKEKPEMASAYVSPLAKTTSSEPSGQPNLEKVTAILYLLLPPSLVEPAFTKYG